jgi:ABC-type arginine transport system permease subunit
MEGREVMVEDRARQRVKKRALLAGAGLVVLGLISGLYAYDESIKGSEVSVKKGRESAAADLTAVAPPLDASRPGTVETATFALG